MDEGRFNQSLNVVFKIGFLLIVIGIIFQVNETMKETFVEMFDMLDLWAAVDAMPAYLKIITAGCVVVLSAIAVGFLKDRVVEMVDFLFGAKDREPF